METSVPQLLGRVLMSRFFFSTTCVGITIWFCDSIFLCMCKSHSSFPRNSTIHTKGMV